MRLNIPFLYHEKQWASIFEWDLLDRVSLEYNFDQLLDQVQQSKFKIAALPVFFDNINDPAYDIRLAELDFSQFDLVILSDIEYYSLVDIRAWIDKRRIKNYVLAFSGLHSNYEVLAPNEIYRPWWAFNLINKDYNAYQDTWHPNKPFMFEAMLGGRRPHRDFVMLAFKHYKLLEKNIVNYRERFGGWDNIENRKLLMLADYFSDIDIGEPYTSKNLKPEWEEALDNITCTRVPYKIFEQTYYSIVCETLSTSPIFFMSEKTARVFWAKRVFVLFGVENFLKQLKSFGFKTFDSVIDESYDQISDHNKRCLAAFDQVRFLSEQDPVEIYNRVKDILDHNHTHLLTLQQQNKQQMNMLLEQHIPSEFMDK